MDVSGAITILVLVLVVVIFVAVEHNSIKNHRPPKVDKTKSAPHRDDN